MSASVLAGDTETDGLEVHRDRLRLVQLCTPDNRVVMIRNPTVKSSPILQQLLLVPDRSIVFHHAGFDLKFLLWDLGVGLDHPFVECTRTLSKMLYPGENASLSPMLKRSLGVEIHKDHNITKSNWAAETLSSEQIEYAAEDVLWLIDATTAMKTELSHSKSTIYRVAMQTIVGKAELEVTGYGDLLEYSAKPVLPLRDAWYKRAKELDEAIKSQEGW